MTQDDPAESSGMILHLFVRTKTQELLLDMASFYYSMYHGETIPGPLNCSSSHHLFHTLHQCYCNMSKTAEFSVCSASSAEGYVLASDISTPVLKNYLSLQNSKPHPLQTCHINQMPYFHSPLSSRSPSSPFDCFTTSSLHSTVPHLLSCRCKPQLNYSSPTYPPTAANTTSHSPPVNKYSLC